MRIFTGSPASSLPCAAPLCISIHIIDLLVPTKVNIRAGLFLNHLHFHSLYYSYLFSFGRFIFLEQTTQIFILLLNLEGIEFLLDGRFYATIYSLPVRGKPSFLASDSPFMEYYDLFNAKNKGEKSPLRN
jgi:hypothetical protein